MVEELIIPKEPDIHCNKHKKYFVMYYLVKDVAFLYIILIFKKNINLKICET
ncbi:hypothetical protein GLUCOINTEAF2_0203108 [Komagataeibacter intermedius AF2]|uniref:Uncharacterized protein n=1 Tax=Komagataeibacter intermedius AF2 TaxID=1458464 RepID=A0A0N0MER4_9PROT|nr:hypothetical protein GLUCOINTEAF2_0203108 [Komagataeibacter intermedius AF2]